MPLKRENDRWVLTCGLCEKVVRTNNKTERIDEMGSGWMEIRLGIRNNDDAAARNFIAPETYDLCPKCVRAVGDAIKERLEDERRSASKN